MHLVNNLDNDDMPKKRSRKEFFAKGSLIAAITVCLLLWIFHRMGYTKNVIEAAIAGLVVHFIVMGFVLEIAKNPSLAQNTK